MLIILSCLALVVVLLLFTKKKEADSCISHDSGLRIQQIAAWLASKVEIVLSFAC